MQAIFLICVFTVDKIMVKYLLKRILHGLFSVVVVVAIVMLLIYSLMDRKLVFATDPQYSKKQANLQTVYMYERWESYGYLDYVSYAEYLNDLVKSGEIDEETRKEASLGTKQSADSELTQEYIAKFTSYYKSKGYTITRQDYDARTKQKQVVFAAKDIPVPQRLLTYFLNLIEVDNIHYVERNYDIELENTGLSFTLFDPLYNYNEDDPEHPLHKVFSPAIMGNGTEHKYLLYFDDVFPYIHQNLVTVNLGVSYSVNRGIDIADTLMNRQDPDRKVTVTFPTGLTEQSPRNMHTATYVPTSEDTEQLKVVTERFTDNYTNVQNFKSSFSKTGFSFVIGLISVVASYLLGVPLGILMARKKNTFIDQLGSIYVIFIIAVPSLAYIFLFRELGGMMGLPKTFMMESATNWMYVLPVISLALPSIANLMKWVRRYMIDQENSDYVKFARSGGLSETEIFTKHILKNAVIPIVHGIPGSVLGALVGAIITERIYLVPGAGYLLTNAISQYDNGVIVGLTLFYALLSILSLILGDILMSVVDPRISFTETAR